MKVAISGLLTAVMLMGVAFVLLAALGFYCWLAWGLFWKLIS